MIPRALLVSLLACSAFGAGRPLAPRQNVPSAYEHQRPAVAYAGGRFLTIWTEFVVGSRVMGSLSDANGRRISESAFALPFANYDDLVAVGNEFVLFAGDRESAFMVRIDTDGHIKATHVLDVPVGSHTTWNGRYFLSVVPTYSDPQLVLFDESGRLVRDPIPIAKFDSIAVTPSSDDSFLVFANRFHLSVARITPEGVVAQTDLGMTASSWSAQVIATPLAGGGAAIAWTDHEVFPKQGQVIRTATVSPSGQLVHSAVVTATAAPSRFVPVQLLVNGSALVLAYAEELLTAQGGELLHTVVIDARGVPVEVTDAVERDERTVYSGASGERMMLIARVAEWPPVRLGYSSTSVSTIVVSADGRRSPPEIVSIGPERQAQPILGTGGGTHVAAWTEYSAHGGTLRTAMVTPDGRPALSEEARLDRVLAASELAWNGSEYLTATMTGDTLYAQRVSASGELGDEVLIALHAADILGGFIPSAAVAWAKDRWIIVRPGGEYRHRIVFTTMTPGGIVSQPIELPLTTPLDQDSSRVIVQLSAAATDDALLLTWIELERPRCNVTCFGIKRAFAARITHDGSVVDAVPMILAEGDPTHVSVVSNGGDFMVVLDQSTYGTEEHPYWFEEVSAHLVTARGAVTRVASRRFKTALVSDVAWDGASYVIASRAGRQLLLWRVHGRGSDRFVRTFGSDLPAAPSIAAAFSGSAVIALQETDVVDGGRATVYAEQDLEAFTVRRPEGPKFDP